MSCSLCDGTGWKYVERDGTRSVTRCDCWRDRLALRLLDDARIPRRYQHCDFANFRDYNESLKRARQSALKLSEAFPVVERGLFFEGPPGVGKTHLAVAVLRRVVTDRGAHALFYDTRDLLRVIRSTYDPVSRTTETEILRPVMTCDLLVLDDLGAEKTTEWVEETLNLIVNTRYNERRTTVFTSNYEDRPDDTDPNSLLCRIGFRMRSRLHEMCDFVELDGGDYREAPTNPGDDDLVNLWKRRRHDRARRVTGVKPAPARAKLPDASKLDLKWPGGRAGS